MRTTVNPTQLARVAIPLMTAVLGSGILLSHPVRAAEETGAAASREFRAKLTEMLDRTEKSIKILREQITESQSAPFLADLYIQLAELLSQRSNTLYYIQQEKLKGAPPAGASDSAMAPVINAQKEAIAVYRMLLKDFPDSSKKASTLFRLSLALKSIDESAEFIQSASLLLREFPDSDEAMRVRLLLGQHFFDLKDFDGALTHYRPVTQSKATYERNLAKYRMGLIAIIREKPADALKLFEEVIRDGELKEQDNPYEISIKSRKLKSNLKREALIDSIRPYTQLHAESGDPLAYYSDLSPTEGDFQEVLEKLALRYIFIKKYDRSIRLLRALSERTADPQKVLGIYRDVLSTIPARDRVDISPAEIGFVLGKYDEWRNSFEIPAQVAAQAGAFFEQQVRELATTGHELAKTASVPSRKALLLERAREFYRLYLGFFGNTASSVKLATNLGDVYFLEQNYFRSGEAYLRTFLGEFGPPPANQRKELIENAILALQKRREYGFYEAIRNRGLLIKAVTAYRSFDPRLKNDPRTQFLLLKSEYEQGFLPESLEKLFAFLKAHPRTQQARDAGELILDYFNTRNDFTAIAGWADRISLVKQLDPEFRRKVATISQQARSRVLQDKIKSAKGYDEFAQGRSYLNAALGSQDSSFSSRILQEALARSKAERDFRTFFAAAEVMAQKEKSAEKRLEIARSIPREYARLTRYRQSIEASRRLQDNTAFPARARVEALEEEINTRILLRDLAGLRASITSPLFNSVSPQARGRVRSLLSDALDSPAGIPGDLARTLLALGLTDEVLAGLFKNQARLPSDVRERVERELKGRCSSESQQAVCRWYRAAALENPRLQFQGRLSGPRPDMGMIEKASQEFMGLVGRYTPLEGSGDPALETLVSLRMHGLYRAFAAFLSRAASAIPDLAQVLDQKSKESLASASAYVARCRTVASRSGQLVPASRFCGTGTNAGFGELVGWRSFSAPSPSGSDPGGGRIDELQAALFTGKSGSDTLMAIAQEYLSKGHLHHAAAASSHGMVLYKEQEREFRAVLGCSLASLGLANEAYYHLRDKPGDPCLKRAVSIAGGAGGGG